MLALAGCCGCGGWLTARKAMQCACCIFSYLHRRKPFEYTERHYRASVSINQPLTRNQHWQTTAHIQGSDDGLIAPATPVVVCVKRCKQSIGALCYSSHDTKRSSRDTHTERFNRNLPILHTFCTSANMIRVWSNDQQQPRHRQRFSGLAAAFEPQCWCGQVREQQAEDDCLRTAVS